MHGFEILRGGTLRVTAAVHRFINYVKQYEKCDLAAGEIPLSAGNVEPRTCERLRFVITRCILIYIFYIVNSPHCK